MNLIMALIAKLCKKKIIQNESKDGFGAQAITLFERKNELDRDIFMMMISLQKDNLALSSALHNIATRSKEYENALTELDQWIRDLLNKEDAVTKAGAWSGEFEWMLEDIQATLAGTTGKEN